ncbi:hypothetical protein [Kribbella sp. NPDC006257]|uniref:hypothetical protein n=1 Tax=Kribbella sp. NPDC006257 TaxID=3156738 RepID=UPI0033A5EFD0
MGTDAWKNWQGFDAGEPEGENYDDELHSDVEFAGGARDFGPFRLSAVHREVPATQDVGLALVLHGGVHVSLIPDVVINGKLAKPDSTAYHGGTMSDEVAALVSLIMGVRLRVAGTARLSGIHQPDDDPGRLPMLFEVPRLTRPGRGDDLIPAAVQRSTNLDDLDRLVSFPSLAEGAQVELVRAARSYASGLWWANEDPNLAWLQLVTAVEIAAKARQLSEVDAVALLKDVWEELWTAIEPADDPVRQSVAYLLAPQIRAARAFRDFLADCAPEPPEIRPQFSPLDWTKIRQHAGKIYEHRSQALHAGKPFPMPMCERPGIEGPNAIQEVPYGLNSGSNGAIWAAKETPMLLSTFEYIARGALLAWWDELIDAASGSRPAT